MYLFFSQTLRRMLLEEVLSRPNMTRAYERVVGNGGAAGIDKMPVSMLKAYLHESWTGLKSAIETGNYEPQAVRRVTIPKPNGGERHLGIPTVFDRLMQQALAQVIEPLCEGTFSDHSYGFRPNRNCHQAVSKAQTYVNAGRTYIVDIDLEKFFDRVNHDYLMHLLSARINDKLVLGLIGKYLRAGILIEGTVSRNTEGTPQGSPLSPLLSNIVLDVLDKELEQRGHSFVRYADDFSIYCTSQRGAERALSSMGTFIEEVLHLKINDSKSGIRRPSRMILLGFGFHIKSKGVWGIRIAPKSISRLKVKIKELTQRRIPVNTPQRIAGLNSVLQGWFHYFKIADCHNHLSAIDKWTRSRLRMCEWKLWKRIRTRYTRLKGLGIQATQAYEWANTRKGYWRTAHSPILCRALNNKWIKQQGYVPLSELYKAYKERSQ
jgi:group II intron reverse transcriptase/maturase